MKKDCYWLLVICTFEVMPWIPWEEQRLMILLNKNIWLGVNLPNWMPHCLRLVNLDWGSRSTLVFQAYWQGISNRYWLSTIRSIEWIGVSSGADLSSSYVHFTPPSEISVTDPIVSSSPELRMPRTIFCTLARSCFLRSLWSPPSLIYHNHKKFLCRLL